LKFQPDTLEGVNVISRLEKHRLWVHQTAFDSSVLVPWVGTVLPWPVSQPEQISAADFEALLAWQPELVIFGSGSRLKFISPQHYRALIERRIGIETMDTAAACRTFNVLVNEGRRVAAALLLDGAAGAPS
jgi:uncharacterized protein